MTPPAEPRTKTNAHLFFGKDEGQAAPGLVSARCNSCGRHTIARPLACIHCLSRDLETLSAGQDAEVIESSLVHHSAGGFTAPYVIAQVRTSEGLTLFSPILGGAEPMAPGHKLAFCLYDREDGALGFAYRRADDAGSHHAGS